MRENKFFTQELVKSLIQLLIILAFYWLIGSTSWFLQAKNKVLSIITDDYLREKTGDNLLVITTFIAYFISVNISAIFRRPIFIKISLEDLLSGDSYSKIIHFEGEKREKSNAVKIKLNIIKRNTFWNRVALYTVKNKKTEILISIGQKDAILYCQPEIISNQIQITETGFKMDIKNILVDNLDNNVPSSMEYNFLIEENTDNDVVGNCELSIKPKLFVNNKKIELLYKFFFKFDIDLQDGFYPVKYIR